MTQQIYLNDTVRVRVTFADIDIDGNKIDIEPVSVTVLVLDSDGSEVISGGAVSITASKFYYDFTPLAADTYVVKFTGILDDGDKIIVQQTLNVVDLDENYISAARLNAEEIILYTAEIDPLYLDPEELSPIYPEAPLAEIGEIVHNYSNEVKKLLSLKDEEDGSTIPFIAIEYIKAAAACELSRTYEFGGEDETSITLGDLSVVNRSAPRNLVSRDNATTWCQLATIYRKEMLSSKTGPRSMQPKGTPGLPVTTSGGYRDPDTGKIIYLSDRELYGPGRKYTIKDTQMPDRDLRSYD